MDIPYFQVQPQEDGYTAFSKITEYSSLITEGDTLDELYNNIIEVVEGYYLSKEIEFPSYVQVENKIIYL